MSERPPSRRELVLAAIDSAPRRDRGRLARYAAALEDCQKVRRGRRGDTKIVAAAYGRLDEAEEGVRGRGKEVWMAAFEIGVLYADQNLSD